MTVAARHYPRLLIGASLCLALAFTPAELAAQKRKPETDPAYKMPPLKPAEIDDTLVIGGYDVGARKALTRMTVAVQVNGTGPYNFVVDSGADTSVIGQRIAK